MSYRDLTINISADNLKSAIESGYPNLRALGLLKDSEDIDEMFFDNAVEGTDQEGNKTFVIPVHIKISKEMARSDERPMEVLVN
ncbi:MAG: hypothetical protein ACREHG_09510 [Candidatus Saccharimonadales bacterium]